MQGQGLKTHKSTSTEEFDKRMECFAKTKKEVEEVNAEAEGKGPDALRLAINPLADMMPEETPLGLIADEADVQKGRRLASGGEDSYRMLAHKAVTVDHHFDGRMVPVKDQG